MEPPKEKLTPFEARLELTNITMDKTHPLHDLYLQKDPTAMQYVDALYQAAYGTGTITIGTGIDVRKP